MTVCHVYWLFDAMVAHIRMTSPYGGDEDDETVSTPSRDVKNVESGFQFAGAMQKSGLNRTNSGITVSTLDAVKHKDPHLADAITDAHFLSLLED